ncbi:uncharacterized protein METZ01_LOCUS490789, partial [marine metagenome]
HRHYEGFYLPGRTPVAAIAAAAAATTAETATSLRPCSSFVNRDRPTAEIFPVQSPYGPLCLTIIGHLYKSEASGSSGISIADYCYFPNLTKSLESFS